MEAIILLKKVKLIWHTYIMKVHATSSQPNTWPILAMHIR